jgi:hypothetical protein
MKTTTMIFIGVGILVLMRAQAMAQVKSQVTEAAIVDPGNWYADQWARIYGADLGVNGQNPAPSTLDAYGLAGEMGFQTPGYIPVTNGF